MVVASVAASLPLFLNLPVAYSAPVALDCAGGNGTVSSSLVTADANGALASDSLTVSNAPVGTTITISYSATSNNNKRAQSAIVSGSASGPSPAGSITINGSAGAGSQLWTKTTGADPTINVTLTKTAATGGAASMNWSATCTPGRTLSITNTTNGAEAGPVNGVLTVTQTSVSSTNTVVSLSYGGTATNTADYSRPASVTIPAGSLSANVTLVVVNDAVVEVAETVVVTLGTVTSGSAAVVAPSSATNTIASDDVGTINVAVTDGSATETPGDRGAFTVRLSAQPSATVTVSIGTSPQCSRAPTSLSFTTANWATAQTVTITPNNDTAVEGPHTCSPASITASNGGYTGVTATPPTIDIADNDTGTIIVATTDNSASEAGATGAFTVRLGFQPSGNVTVTIGASPQCTFSRTTLVFTTVNWNTAQSTIVTAVNDTVAEQTHTCSPASITAANGNYDGVTGTPPTINITDNDTGTFVTSATDNSASEAGDTGTITVRLGVQPVGDVTMTIGASAQCGFSPTGMTFTNSNWNVDQTVTVTPLDDAIVEGAHTCASVSITGANGGYSGVTATLPAINIADNETGALVVVATDTNATETPGDTGAFTVNLSLQPASNVTVSIGTSSQCARAPASLTFTTANWNTPQTVTLTPNDDAVVEGSHACAPASISAANGGYGGVTGTPPTIAITDNDVGAIIVATTDDAANEAPGDTGAFTVRLGLQPSAGVTVTIGASTQCNFSPVSLTFTTSDWATPRNVTVTPINDAVTEGTHSCSPESITAANGSYTGVTGTPPAITITDDDFAGIVVSTGGPLTVTEAGSTATFTVVLTSQPTGDVTLPLTPSNVAEAQVSPITLTFTATTWNIAQTVTVAGVDDAVDDGDMNSSIALGPSTSSDSNYAGLSPAAVAVTTSDDDTAGIAVSTSGPLTVAEAGSTATFTVVLTSEPTGDVTLPLTPSNTAEAQVSPLALTFTSTTWNIGQTVTITGVDDFIDDGDVASSIALGPSASSDGNYGGLTPAAIGVTTTDDDAAGITVSGGPLTVTEAGSSATFTVVLASQPMGDVSVPLAASNPAEASVSPASLAFTVTTWNVARTVTVTGVDDATEDGDVGSSVTIGATTSSDANYNGLTAAVGVTTTDDDAMINAVVREAFNNETHDFMARRQDLILNHEPSFHRLVNRGRAGWSAGENAVSVHGYDGEVRGSFSLNARSAAAALTGPRNVGGEPSYDPSTALNAWAEGQFGLYSEDESGSAISGDFFLGYAGVDWRLNERLMIGIMGEVDWLHEMSSAASGDIEGTGWMVGPYISYAVSEKLFLDVRAMWGRSENQAALEVLGSGYRGDFDTERWLVDARLAGLHQLGRLTIQPELGLAYMSEDQLDYAVAGGDRNLAMDGQFVSTGVLSAGGEISQGIPFDDLVIEPFMRGRVLWSFDDPLQESTTDNASTDALGGQVGLGLAISSARSNFSAELTYGAIGLDNLEVFAAKLSFDYAF